MKELNAREFYRFKEYKLIMYFVNNNIGSTVIALIPLFIQFLQNISIYLNSDVSRLTQSQNTWSVLSKISGVFIGSKRSYLNIINSDLLFYIFTILSLIICIAIIKINQNFQKGELDFKKTYWEIIIICNIAFVFCLIGYVPMLWNILDSVTCGNVYSSISSCSLGNLISVPDN